MSAVAGKTITGKVWHVLVWTINEHDRVTGRWVPLCGARARMAAIRTALLELRKVPAYGLCQHCSRTVEQIAAAVREVQS